MKSDTELMDLMEKTVVGAAAAVLQHALPEEALGGLTYEEAARNIVSKVGTRIAFGKEIYDTALAMKKNK